MLAPLHTEPVGERLNMYIHDSAKQPEAFHYFWMNGRMKGNIVTIVHVKPHPSFGLSTRRTWAGS